MVDDFTVGAALAATIAAKAAPTPVPDLYLIALLKRDGLSSYSLPSKNVFPVCSCKPS